MGQGEHARIFSGTPAWFPWPSICFSWRFKERRPPSPLTPPTRVRSGRKHGCLLWKFHSLPSCLSLFSNEFSNLGYFRIQRHWSEGSRSVWFVLRLPARGLACAWSRGPTRKEEMLCVFNGVLPMPYHLIFFHSFPGLVLWADSEACPRSRPLLTGGGAREHTCC